MPRVATENVSGDRRSAGARDGPFTLFLDANFGSELTDALRAAAAGTAVERVVRLVEEFPQDADDEAWLPLVGARGWALLTRDKAIRRRALERKALETAGVAAFVLTSGGMKGAEIVAAFVKALPKVERFLRTYARGEGHYFIARVSPAGEVTLHEGGTRWADLKRKP